MEGRERSTRTGRCVQVEVHSLEKYLSTSKEKILREVSCSRIIANNKYGRSKEEINKEH